MRIAIVGTGHVGLVTGACFVERGHEVLCVDNDERKIQMLLEGRMPFYEPGLAALVKKGRARKRLVFGTSLQKAAQYGPIVFLAVGTPSGPGGASDMTALEAASRQLARHAKGYLLVVEKSTVPARTGEKVKRTLDRESRPGVILDVASNPEFLREGSAVEDALRPDRIVIGVSNKKAERILREVYRGHKAPLIVTDISSAEIIKHASNAYLATKISFINAVAHLCEACGADVELVARGVGLDPRIGEAFLKAGLGYGGSCFPKDVDAFYRLSVELGAPMEILQEVQKINREQLGRFLRRVEQELWVLRGKTIAQFGLAFKPDTDDVRESIALGCARALAEAGAKVRAFDPQAMDAARPHLGPGIQLCLDAYQAAEGADCLVVATEWPAFRGLQWERIRTQMAHPIVFDGRNLLDPARMKRLGFVYHSVGRPRPAEAAPLASPRERHAAIK